MGTDGKIGPDGQRVAENVKTFRTWHGMSVRDLSAKLKELGRPILPSGITKIEHGERRVDADDLVALAAALKTTPIRLLVYSDDVLHKLEELGLSTPIFSAVFNELVNGADQLWVNHQLDTITRILPVLAEWAPLMRDAIEEGTKSDRNPSDIFEALAKGGDRGEHQETT